jgi:hypothetical protein
MPNGCIHRIDVERMGKQKRETTCVKAEVGVMNDEDELLVYRKNRRSLLLHELLKPITVYEDRVACQ